MKPKYLTKEILYDGSQLRTHFAYDNGVEGNSIIGFVGGAEVSDHMVDKEDLKTHDFIYSEKMFHIIVTLQNEADTEKIVMFQRMLMRIMKDILNDVTKTTSYELFGDDIMKTYKPDTEGGKKLSVSIATKSLFAGLIHTGLNILPVPKGKVKIDTCCLSEIAKQFNTKEGIKSLFDDISEKFINEFISIKKATYKVIAVP